MTISVGLASEDLGKQFHVGDPLKLEALIDEKVGGPTDTWKFSIDSAWIVAGDFAVDTKSLEPMASDGNFTKLQFTAIPVKAGEATLKDIAIVHIQSGQKFELSGKILEKSESISLSLEDSKASWLLPRESIDQYDKIAVGFAAVFALVILMLAARGIWQVWRKRRGSRTKSAEELALESLKKLEGIAKSSQRTKDWKKFSYELANTLKRYTDAKLGIDTRDLTDRELIQAVAQESKGREFNSILEPTLNELIEARYGTKIFDLESARKLIKEARDFVHKILEREKAEVKK